MRLPKITGRTGSKAPPGAASAGLYQQLFHTTLTFWFLVFLKSDTCFSWRRRESVFTNSTKVPENENWKPGLVHSCILFHQCFLEFGCFYRRNSKHLSKFLKENKNHFVNQLKFGNIQEARESAPSGIKKKSWLLVSSAKSVLTELQITQVTERLTQVCFPPLSRARVINGPVSFTSEVWGWLQPASASQNNGGNRRQKKKSVFMSSK